MNRAERIHLFTTEIWQWYSTHKRSLPWRDLSIKNDAERTYQILVSEVMLQQTQVGRVKILFKEFLKKFPKLRDLSSASNREIILAWRGMGYNNRALRLRDAATMLQTFPSVPTDMKTLMSLPGVGHYTAAAIRNFAFNLKTPCLDTNIRRILHRTFMGPEKEDGTWEKDDTYLLSLAADVLEAAITPGTKRDARNWHAALMDFGSLVCTTKHPRWDLCPLTRKGIMKAAYRAPTKNRSARREPGRFVGSTFVPNRIFRGKVVEELRDAADGLTLHTIGKTICIDWSEKDHEAWLTCILEKLIKDQLIQKKSNRFVLSS